MPVVAGLAIPKGAPDRAAAAELIEYLTRPEMQVATLREIGFFPVVEGGSAGRSGAGHPAGERTRSSAGRGAGRGASLLPVGLGEKGGEFNKVFIDTFQLIVVRGRDIADARRARARSWPRSWQDDRRRLLGAGRAVRRPLPGRVSGGS